MDKTWQRYLTQIHIKDDEGRERVIGMHVVLDTRFRNPNDIKTCVRVWELEKPLLLDDEHIIKYDWWLIDYTLGEDGVYFGELDELIALDKVAYAREVMGQW